MTFAPCCLATGIGSLPFDRVERALALIAETCPELPCMPQLPALSWHEGMVVQYTEGLPGLVLDEKREKLHLDTDRGLAELEAFYSLLLEDDPQRFAISESYCRGLTALLGWLPRAGQVAGVKTQVTGPVTQGLSLVDQNRRALFYDETFQEVVTKTCAMKSRFLVRRLREHHPVVLCFLDEPILAAFGSSVYVSIDRETVIAQLGEVVQAVRAEGALCGAHCCGNTDWTLLTGAEVDILSFDAFEFAHSLPLYPEAIRDFVQRGGIIAWGVVPTSAAVLEQTVDSLQARLQEAMAGVERLGLPRRTLLRQALLTPACGLGSAPEEVARRALGLLRELSLRMQPEAAGPEPR